MNHHDNNLLEIGERSGMAKERFAIVGYLTRQAKTFEESNLREAAVTLLVVAIEIENDEHNKDTIAS